MGKNSTIKLLAFIMLLVLSMTPGLTSQLFAQGTALVKGTVVDETGKPIIGATVIKQGTQIGVSTDVDGKYSIKAGKGDILLFNYIGYEPYKTILGTSTEVNATLMPSTQQIEEVVVQGYGSIKSSNLSTAISKVKSEDVQDFAVARLESALDGQLAGVQVQQSSGVPGEAPQIRVRGVGSISASTAPLYVIDGFAIEDPEVVGNMNMNDVESMTVLKDASAAAIYGSRGSNGVIIITTKKASESDAKIEFRASLGLQTMTKRIDMLNTEEWAEMYLEKMSQHKDEIAKYLVEPKTYNHLDAIMRTALRQNYSMSIRGGSQKIKYIVSGDYLDQKGIVMGSNFKRYSGRVSVNADLKKWLSLSVNVNPSYSSKRDPGTDRKEGNIHKLLMAPPIQPTMDGVGNSAYIPVLSLQRTYGAMNKILYWDVDNYNTQILGDIAANVTLLPRLVYTFKAGLTYRNNGYDEFTPKVITRTTPKGAYRGTEARTWMVDNILTYNFTLGQNHNFSPTLIYSAQDSRTYSKMIYGSDFPAEQIHTLNMAGIITQNSGTTISQNRILSYVARLNYDYQGKYIASASFRRDGSSRFPNNPWGNFFAASAAWNIHQERFFEGIQNTLSTLKLRVSYGQTGNNRVGDYAAYNIMNKGASIDGSGNKIQGLFPNNISNPDLTWEKKSSYNIGLDFGFLDNKITGSFELYTQDTEDLLLDVPVSGYTGFASMSDNIGAIRNKGVELEVSSRNINKKFRWETSVNIAFNDNKVLRLGTDNAPIITGDGFSTVSLTMVGQPVGMFYMHIFDGIFRDANDIATNPAWDKSAPGDIKLLDINGDNKIDNSDRAMVGRGIPTYNFGMTNKFSYKSWQLTCLVTGQGGNKVFNAIARQIDSGMDESYNYYKHWARRWRSPENPGDGKTPRAFGAGANNLPSTRWLYDGDFVRISNITLSYTLPPKVRKKIRLGDARVYVSADNVATFDKYTVGWNPQVSSNGTSPLAPGYDYGAYPLPTTFSFGISFTL